MAYHCPTDTVFRAWTLEVEDRTCEQCQHPRTVCCHRQRRFFTCAGPVLLVCKLRLAGMDAAPRSPEDELDPRGDPTNPRYHPRFEDTRHTAWAKLKRRWPYARGGAVLLSPAP